MTEDELFTAVHEYADEIAFVTSDKTGEPVAAVGHPDDHKAAREKLLDAIREYVASLPIEICSLEHARWMRAKAAVCDAFLAQLVRFDREDITAGAVLFNMTHGGTVHALRELETSNAK